MKIYRYYILINLIVFFSCASEENYSASGFRIIPSSESGIDFKNEISNTEDFNIFNYRNFYNGGGVAIGDMNNDGLEDIYFTANAGPNQLYINKGKLQFENITEFANVGCENQWSTGATFVDINNDGFKDLYVCNAGIPKNGDQRNYFFINNGDNTFEEKAIELGLADTGYTTHIAFFDYDKDNDLDAYILNNSFIPANTLNYSNKRDLPADQWDVKDFLKGGGDKLMRNDGGTFTDVTQESGIYSSLIGFGLGITIGDVNNDTYPDLYISNDFFEKDYLYINNQQGGFKESIESYMNHISHSSMGADMADINNDGFLEIFVTDMLPRDEYRFKTTTSFDNINQRELKKQKGFYNQFMHNTLQLNNNGESFNEVSFYADVAASDWSWGALILDVNNDGNQDIYVSNGIYHDVIDQDFIDFFSDEIIQKMALTGEKQELNEVINRMPSEPIVNHLFINQGNLKFIDQASELGLNQKTFSNGAAYADLDKDGDLDLVVNNLNQESLLLENKSMGNHFIAFELIGDGSNIDAIGTRVEVFTNSIQQVRELMPSRGFQSSSSSFIHVGLKNNTKIDSVKITWFDQSVSVYTDLSVDQYHTINKKDAATTLRTKGKSKTVAFTLNTKDDFVKHQENNYIDFLYEANIPMMLSQEGPNADQADVDNDGDLDLYIAGGAGQAGTLYLWVDDRYVAQQSTFKDFPIYEETVVHFFDSDGDGDQDLFIGSGGNERPIGDRFLQHRLFENDGNGKFKLSNYTFPPNGVNTAVAVSNDFDGDGDLDLFVGGRCANSNYGLPGISYIYLNNGNGRFSELAKTEFENIYRLGMVTDAKWANIDGKGGDELIVVGEWMAPKIFTYTGSAFEEMEYNLGDKMGLWYSVETADINNDGNLDLILGNIGTNFYLTSKQEELSLWINDFNDNGNIEKVLTKSVAERDIPIFNKRDLTNQLPSIKKENLMHRDYANKSIQNILDTDKLNRSLKLTAKYFDSVIAYGDGLGSFVFEKLPLPVQLSSVNAICVLDYDEDGFIDIVTGGNKYDVLPQFSRLDASSGLVILNDGKEKKITDKSKTIELNVSGEIQDFIYNRAAGITILRNNDSPLRLTSVK